MRLKTIPLSIITVIVSAIASFPVLITGVSATSKQVETPISPFGTIPLTSPGASGGWMNSRSNAPDNSDRKQGVASLAALERTVYQQVNQYRQSRNLPPLAIDERISQQARLHSQAMANGSVSFSHNGFDQRAQAIAQAIPNRGTAENVAYNQGYADPVAQALRGWVASEVHRRNLEGQYTMTGIGVAQNSRGQVFLTQLFVQR
jgi:uncharacterized protein YkwD